jgi:D-glycero-D-manno-heptose 1,7-bisphosphate phosphatase
LKRAVFLDRDGVINRAVVRDGKPFPPKSATEVEVLPDARDALLRLRDAGYMLIVVTNQPDVARGTQERAEVEQINERLANELAIDDFFVCYHDDAEACNCRKPEPGGLVEAAQRHQVDLASSYMVGDRWRDVEAGQRAGCTPFFIDYGYAERQPAPPFERVGSLAEAAERIMILHSRRPDDSGQ